MQVEAINKLEVITEGTAVGHFPALLRDLPESKKLALKPKTDEGAVQGLLEVVTEGLHSQKQGHLHQLAIFGQKVYFAYKMKSTPERHTQDKTCGTDTWFSTITLCPYKTPMSPKEKMLKKLAICTNSVVKKIHTQEIYIW